MRTVIIIITAAVLIILTGCGAARRSKVAAEPAAASAGQQESAEEVPEVAPFGNAALAGKPDEGEAAEHVWDFRDATTWLLGDLTPAMLNNPPHSEWFHKGYEEYQPHQEVLGELIETGKDDLTITIVLGTWCPDSRREVPRFMKIIDLLGFPREKIRLIGVDINKIAPLEDYGQLSIERVPTFIFYKNNIEKGRIIEVPVTSLEQDTRDILKGN